MDIALMLKPFLAMRGHSYERTSIPCQLASMWESFRADVTTPLQMMVCWGAALGFGSIGQLPDLHLHNYLSVLWLHTSQVLSTVAAYLPVIKIRREPNNCPERSFKWVLRQKNLFSHSVALNGWLELREAALGLCRTFRFTSAGIFCVMWKQVPEMVTYHIGQSAGHVSLYWHQ